MGLRTVSTLHVHFEVHAFRNFFNPSKKHCFGCAANRPLAGDVGFSVTRHLLTFWCFLQARNEAVVWTDQMWWGHQVFLEARNETVVRTDQIGRVHQVFLEAKNKAGVRTDQIGWVHQVFLEATKENYLSRPNLMSRPSVSKCQSEGLPVFGV
jgi:hypothetical protein